MVGVTEKLNFSFYLATIHLTLKAARMDRVVCSKKTKNKKPDFLVGLSKSAVARSVKKASVRMGKWLGG